MCVRDRLRFIRLMSSNKKKALFKTVFTANGSCGCGKTKASEVLEPTPKPKISNIHHQNTTTNTSSMASSFTTSHNGGFSVEDEDSTSTTISESETTHDHNNNKSPNNNSLVPKRSPLMDTLAVEKDSSDPYHDFRHSMLQMIFEKEIESEDDLQDLLQCFLELNAPRHHHVIVKAFNEICEEAFPEKVSATPAAIERSPISRTNHIIIRETSQ